MKKLYFLLFAPILSFSAQIEGTWKLAPQAGALAVGDAGQGAGNWWTSGAGEVTNRACFFDDSIKFEANGNMTHYMDGSTWLETWQGVGAESCGAPVAPHAGGVATYAYNAAAGTLTVNGLGAHIGLPKVNNAGEIPNGAPVASTITYLVSFSNGGNTMTADINFGPGWWRFVYNRIVAPVTQEIVGTWKLAPQAGALAVGDAGQGAGNWWTSGAGEVTNRACFFDDSIKFEANGNMTHYMDGSTWLETWQGVGAESCGAPVAPHAGGVATYAYNAAAGTLTVNGLGAHIGLPKVNNAGEIPNGAPVASTITYLVSFSNGGNTMTADINFGPGWWRFIYNRIVPTVAQDYDVTFNVDMSQYTGDLTGGVFVNADFNNWCGTCNPMTEVGNGIWSTTLTLAPGPIQYQFLTALLDAEEITGPCTITTGQYTNRADTIVGNATLPNVCWESCSACVVGISELDAAVAIYPNPVNTIMTVKATDAMQQIRILDLTGKEVASFVGNGLTQEINVEALKAGIYTIQIATATGNSSKQFVKK